MTSSQNLFWFVVGAMTGAAAMTAALVAFRRLHGRVSGLRVGVVVIGTLSAAAVVAISLHRLWGTPAALTIDTKLVAAMSAIPESGVDAGRTSTPRTGSVEEAAMQLAKRLDTQGGSSSDWLLLAQSYEFIGRSDDAKRAREHAGAPVAAPDAAAPVAGSASAPGPLSAAGQRLLAEAEKYRIAHQYPQAIAAYGRLVQMNGMSADAWANYADATASANGGKLAGPPGDYLARALKIDPDHPKALWLQASLLDEQQRYREAAGAWRHLATLLPVGSSDAKIIAANLAEAQRLAGPGSESR
jgi:cytochrome c-type biogenesis protein CcmH/NrfG